jgi:D-3-phosphoglycerate dehydrogenase
VNAAKKRIVYVERLASLEFSRVIAERPDVAVQRLARAAPDSELRALVSTAHAYQVPSARDDIDPRHFATRTLLGLAPDLLVVSTGGAGFDTVDLDACTEAGVLAINQAGGNREAVAEHALAMMLCLSKKIVQVNAALRREMVTSRERFIGNDIFGKTVGIVGFGQTGTRLAQLCRAFSMRVLACDPYVTAEQIAAHQAEKVELGDLLSSSDFVSLNCPLTAETRGMIGKRELSMMRPHAYFITTARGGIHDEAALDEALRNGAIAGAGVDVWEREPPPPDHSLLQLDNVLASPHTAGVTHEARSNVGTIAARQILDVFDGRRPPHLLNPEVWPAYVARCERILGARPQA